MPQLRSTRLAAGLALGALALTGCTQNSPQGGGEAGSGALQVRSTDSECAVSAAQAPSGRLTFSVRNDGSKVTEFYLLGDDRLRIVGEVENIGPGLTRDLVVKAPPGQYFTACKPGMVGEGIQSAFTVTDSGADLAPAGEDKEFVEAASAQYASYVKEQTDQLLAGTKRFAAAVKAGDDEKARELYAPTRVHWERIETVAESFGDLDPRMDLREADLEPGQEWTGWHALEKDLWRPDAKANGGKAYEPLTKAERARLADRLVADTQTLHQRTREMGFTPDQIGNGAKGLLDEVATGKVTGEEEIWSHTDLWDFQANVEGAEVAWKGLQPLLQKKDAELDRKIGAAFKDLDAELAKHREGEGFVAYTELSPAEVKALSDKVNALSEPLSRMTGAVTQ